eukprot:15288274-Alexandrium_andersonii.AAC.1
MPRCLYRSPQRQELQSIAHSAIRIFLAAEACFRDSTSHIGSDLLRMAHLEIILRRLQADSEAGDEQPDCSQE